MTNIDHILHDIEADLSAIPYNTLSPEGLYSPIMYALEGGGKRVRPLLCTLACEIFCGDYRRALIPALALELYHNHTLLHDDVMDDSPLRRGRPTVYHQWGQNAAILSGDAMLIAAFDYLVSFGDKETLSRILPLFSRMCLAVCEGQRYDMEFEDRKEVRPEEYLQMISLKTSALIAYSLRIGAMVGGASDDDAELLYNFGLSIGQAFQLEDDLLDVFGTEAVLGKPIGGDIVHNKKTMLLIRAMDTAKGSDASELEALLALGEQDRAKKVREISKLYKHLGVDIYTRSLIDEYEKQAKMELDNLKHRGVDISALALIAAKLSKREK